MPIKPENRKCYPPTWPQIRKAVLQRAKDRCELCGAPNKQWIARRKDCPAVFELSCEGENDLTHFSDAIRVILTVAHLDQTYGSSDPKYLLALCQRCHLKIDRFANSVRRGAAERPEKERFL